MPIGISRLVAKEQDIQRAIMDYLKARGVLHWRVNMGGVRRSGIGRTANPMKGFPDIAGVWPDTDGCLFVIEVKRPGEQLEPHQVKWRDRLVANRVTHITATSIEDVRRYGL